MTTDKPCDKFLESWSGSASPSPEFLEHMASCPDCAALVKTARHVREKCSINPPAALAGLRDRILKESIPESPSQEVSSKPGPVKPSSFLPLGILFFALAVAIGVLISQQEKMGPKYRVTVPGEAATEIPLDQPLHLGSGTARIELPQNVTLECDGPAYAAFSPYQVQLFWGSSRFTIGNTPATFTVILPGGRLEARSASFRCDFSGNEIELIIGSGSALIIEEGKAPFTLASGGKAQLIPVLIPTGSDSLGILEPTISSATHPVYETDEEPGKK